MRNQLFIIILGFFLTGFQGVVFAQEGDQYLLPKFGRMAIDVNNVNSLTSMGVMVGYGLSKHFSLEAELNTSVNGGAYSRKDALGNTIETGEYQVQTLASYMAVRKMIWGTTYAKGKAGILYETVKRSSTLDQSGNDKSLGLAGGIGGGMYLFDQLTMELEATQIDRKIRFYSLGMHLKF